MPRTQSVVRGIPIKDELWGTIKQAAEVEATTASQYIREAVLERLKKEGHLEK